MLDETIITEEPPLYGCYGRIGQQVQIPLTGSHARRILLGAINLKSGDVLLWIVDTWDQFSHQQFLRMIRSHWSGWNLVLFQDRASQHTAPFSLHLAKYLGIDIRLLPKATPELNAMDHLWRHTERSVLADRRTIEPVDESALRACQYIIRMSPRERLRQAGVLSGNFWLSDVIATL